MKTETNKYHQALLKKAAPLTAEGLLIQMRPKVEKVLRNFLLNTPTSQAYRAGRLLTEMEEDLPHFKTLPAKKAALTTVGVLKDFLAVHRTVWILEGRAI